MCGRYVSVARVAELIEQYKPTGPGDDQQLAPSYNVAPTNRSTPSSSATVPTGRGQCGRSPRCGGSSAGMVETRHRPEVREGEDHADAAQRPVRQGGPPRRRGRARSPSAGRSSPPPGTTSGSPPRTPTGTRGSRSMKQLRPAPSSGARSLSLTRHRVELPDIDRHCVHAVQLLPKGLVPGVELLRSIGREFNLRNPTSNVDFGFGPSRATFASKRLNHTS
jgi:hypothetical protein